jgi:DNA polymerase-3 subunit gamma/tau
VVASAPVARASAPASEPPPWLDDEPPYEGEVLAAEVSVREPEPQKMQRPPAPVPAAAASWVPTPLGDRWAEVVSQMNEAASISALVRELAMQAQCVAIDEQAQPTVWRLRVERETLRTPAQRDKLQAALSELLKQPVQLELEAGVASDTPAQRAGAERARRQNEAEQIIHNDPLVQALMQQFKTARIVPGSVKFH